MSTGNDATWALALDAAPEAILVIDHDGVVVKANRRAAQLFGGDQSQFVGRSAATFIPFSPQLWDDDVAGAGVLARRSDGTSFEAEYATSSLRVESARYVVAIVRDATFHAELGAKPNAEADQKMIAEWVRLQAEDARVRAEGEKTIAERVRLEAEDARVQAEGEKTIAERVRLEAEVERIKAESEKTEAERVRLEAEMELERLKGYLHQSQRMESLGQLAGGVAHDFNNLLAVILNYASFVVEELDKAVAEPDGAQWSGPLDDVKQIQVAAERAGVLTHQLLAFARREVIQARSLNVNDAVRDIEEMLRRTIGEQIELSIELEGELAPVMADPGHIEQIILNLAINARDAMPQGGTLSIVTSSRDVTDSEWTLFGAPTGAYVCIQFSDNGIGMSSEVRERAFEPFFTTKPRGEGSGLGLATVYGIVLQSGGFTKIYSDEGIGTCVTILLPIDEMAGAQNELASNGLRKASLGGVETILVVDDEAGLREVTRRMLSRNGYTVLTASSGAEAIELAASYVGVIDLLLTDVIMPKMQGPTVAKEVSALRPNIRILFMSGHAQPVLEAEAVLETQFQLVEKPFDQKMLLTNVRTALDVARA